MINTSKPTTSLVNSARVYSWETWDSILTTWSSETRTWDMTGSLLSNTSKPTTNITNTSKP